MESLIYRCKIHHLIKLIIVILLFDMVAYTKKIIENNHLALNGYLFFAYPKKGNKRQDEEKIMCNKGS